MVSIEKVKNGLQCYLEEELIHKLSGWQKWIIGAGLATALDKAEHIVMEFNEMPVIKMLDIIDEHGNVDIETIYKNVLPMAEKESAIIPMPLIGELKLTADDVNKMYHWIMKQ